MSELDDLREALRAARAERDAAVDELARAREELRRARTAEVELERSLDGAADDERKRAAQRVAGAETALKEAADAAASAREREQKAFAALSKLTDPRRTLGQLSDDVPFVLLPLRLETRFRDVGGDHPQLLVRVYPDACAIDTFEPTLSDTELARAREYWEGIWAAGGVEDDERAAWRGLVASHGSGRAGWIVDRFRPLNDHERPRKSAREELVLAIGTDAPPSDDERRALAEYWAAVWYADGSREREERALEELASELGGRERADELVAAYPPFNIGDRPPAPPSVSVAFVVLPADVETTRDTWSRPPSVHVMPDRFVLIASSAGERIEAVGRPVPSPLVVGPDPSAPPEEQLRPRDGGLEVPDEMLWLVDFDRAVEWGLGFAVDLTPAQASRGIDELVVLGVRISATEADSQKLLEELLEHHANGHGGFSLVPQGTPTNNTEEADAGHARGDDADASFDVRARAPLFAADTDPLDKRDGQWLAELLGIRPAVLERTPHADGTDQLEARAMQTALWPATLGYFLRTMMDPLVDDADVDTTRAFFVEHVSGRGGIPAIRIGRQPYGVLATTAFSRTSWPARDPFLGRLAAILDVAGGDWRDMSRDAASVGSAGDPHATLLRILGLHPSSVEFHQRYAESLEHLFNELNLAGLGGALVAGIIAAGLERQASDLLGRLGHRPPPRPAMLDRYFLGGHTVLSGDAIDDRPVSETSPIRVWASGERNYIRWLIDAARRSLDTLRRQTGFLEDRPPSALLYLLLRHALLLGYHDAGYRLHLAAGARPAAEVAAMKREPPFVHVASTTASESRWSVLYGQEPAITGSPTRTLADYIAEAIPSAPPAAHLRQQLKALGRLADVPTGRLERAFAEHVDCCSYRLDAWRLGLVRHQLAAMRFPRAKRGEAAPPRQGLHLGAYGWLEDIRPATRAPSRVELDEELARELGDGPPLLHDPDNGGYIHAPSLDHAATAAVLRSGYLANSTSGDNALAVNLSSARVREALSLLEGVRQGQSLGALLGYRLERGLHDAHDLAEVDHLVYGLRKAFPLRADRLGPTSTGPGVPIEAVEARNVVDGLQLLEHVREIADPAYPYGLPLPAATAPQAAAVDAELERLLEVHDAVADLALAEGVHQAVLGNYDRVAGTLDAYTKGHHPPEPDVVRTPSSGTGLTHRVGLHLQPGLATPADNPTPRSTAEPALNAWLADLLPPLASIACRVRWTDPATAAEEVATVTMEDLGLQPIDLLALVRTDTGQAMTELDERMLQHVIDAVAPRPDATLAVHYMERPDGAVSVFEAAASIMHLRALVAAARPLRPSDVALPREATQAVDESVSVDRARVAAVREELNALEPDLTAFLSALETLLDDLSAREDDLVDGVDGFVEDAVPLLERAARFGIPRSGWGFAHNWRRQEYAALLERVHDLVTTWDARLAAFDGRLADYDALPAGTPDRDRVRMLHQAELEVSTSVTPPPDAPADLRTALDGRRAAFQARRDQLAALPGAAGSLAGLIAAVAALLPASQLVADPFTLDEERRRVVLFARDLAATVHAVADEVRRRLDASQELLDAHDAAASAAARVDALQRAAKALLGEDFVLVPEFTLGSEQAVEWRNALDASGTTLLRHLLDDLGIELPVDEWLYGAARVRPPLRAWEQAVLLAGGFGRSEPELTPIQLPHRPGEPWLAMQLPPGHVIDGDRLLYTAHYSVPFDSAAPQCGLLLDEWTEVIPGKDQVSGLAFNFDRPSAEAPQSLLVVTPAAWDGSWHWDDLVGALHDTLALAKQRAVEPDQLDGTAYARFLPATVMAAAASGISIATTLAANNGVLEKMSGGRRG